MIRVEFVLVDVLPAPDAPATVLLRYDALTMRSAVNPIRMVLNGGFPPGTAGNPRPYGMPPFRPTLNDDEVAAVVSYIRNSWGNRAGLVSPLEVDRFRSAPVD